MRRSCRKTMWAEASSEKTGGGLLLAEAALSGCAQMLLRPEMGLDAEQEYLQSVHHDRTF